MAATNIVRHENHFSCDGVPEGEQEFMIYGLVRNDTCYDQIGKKMYRWRGTAWLEDNVYGAVGAASGGGGDPIPGPPGEDGADATITIGTVTTTTLAAGAQASVTVTDTDLSTSAARFNFDFSIPKGAKGDKGDPGSGSGGGTGDLMPGFVVHNPNIVETPVEILVLGTGTDDLVGTGTYPDMPVAPSDLYDWANLQYAIYLAKTRKKALRSAGTFYTDKSIELYKDLYTFSWDGGLITTIQTQNNDPYAIIGRYRPVDNNEANVMISNSSYMLRGIIIKGQDAQIGLELISTYSSEVRQIRVSNCDTGIHLRFCLNTRVVLCDGGTCFNGMIADMGNWSGASNANSQSNHTTFYQCHLYYGLADGGNVGFGVYASSGVIIDHCIVEGHKYKKCVEWDNKASNVVKEFTIKNTHFETIQGNAGGSTEAYVWLRGYGTAYIEGVYNQYPGVLINASGSPAQLTVRLTGTEWTVTPPDGKLIYNAGGVMYDIINNNCSQFSNPSTIESFFSGTPVAKCGGFACGLNKYIIHGFGF